MEIMLLEDVAKVGERGEIVKVSDGYARNYLIPRKLAVKVDSKNKKMLDNERRKIERQNRKRLESQKEMAAEIQQVELEFVQRAHEGVLYGSVTREDIAEELKTKGLDVQPRQIMLDENIKQVGTHSIAVRIREEVQANLTLHVIADE